MDTRLHLYINNLRFVLKLVVCLLLATNYECCNCNRDAKAASSDPEQNWGYSATNGPSTWCQWEPQCCGLRQSPIDIVTSSVVDSSTALAAVNLQQYVTGAVAMAVKVDGRTVFFKRDAAANSSGTAPAVTVTGGCLGEAEYVLEAFHFHWGGLDKQGSEHTIDGHAFPLEMHLLHRNVRYATIDAALNYSDGLAVFSVLIMANETVSGDSNTQAAYNELYEVLSTPGLSDGQLHTFTLSSGLRALLPNSGDQFYCYAGSLSTPHCNEVVTWTVFATPVVIARDFLDRLRQVPAGVNDAVALEPNFRPVQPLNGRQIIGRLGSGVTLG